MPRPHRVSRPRRLIPLVLLSGSLLLHLWLAVSQAQVRTALMPDGTLGTAITQSGHVYSITGGTRPGNGPNLFHSFERFSVGTGDMARFTGPQTGITHILSRVTGGQRSDIDGTLRSEMPGAHLYLLNPVGVMFGPNASLDVSGSFHVSTADYLRLADGATFSAHLSDTSVLTVAPPAAFGFLGPTPAMVTIQNSSLQVATGQTLSVIGGNIAISGGTLMAPSGRMNLTSVAAAGEVGLNPTAPTAPLQIGTFARLGQVHLVDAHLDVSGSGGGTVVIRGGQLLLANTSVAADTQGDVHGASVGVDIGMSADAVITNGSRLTADVGGAGNAGSIRIAADSLAVSQASRISAQSSADTTGNGGHIDIATRLLQVTDGSKISGETHGAGQGGTVTVAVADSLTLTGPSPDQPSEISTSTFGAGTAGNVVVQAHTLTMQAGTQVASSSSRMGDTGTVVVDGGTVTLSGGTQIFTVGTGAGRAISPCGPLTH